MKFYCSHYYYSLFVLLISSVVPSPFFSLVAVVDAHPQKQEDRRSCPSFPKEEGKGDGGGCKNTDESLVCLRKDGVATGSKKLSKKASSATTTTTTTTAVKEYEQACVKDTLLEGVFIGDTLIDGEVLADCGCCTESLRMDVRNDLLLTKDIKLSSDKGLKCLDRSDIPTCFTGSAAYVTQQCQTQLKGNRQCCTGVEACVDWVNDYATVCEGACRGFAACIGLGGSNAIIGARSCQGPYACGFMGDVDPSVVVQVGRDSCVGDNAPCALVGSFAPQSVRIGKEACLGGKSPDGSIETGWPCYLVGYMDADSVSIADGACVFRKSELSTCNLADGPGSLVCTGKTCSFL